MSRTDGPNASHGPDLRRPNRGGYDACALERLTCGVTRFEHLIVPMSRSLPSVAGIGCRWLGYGRKTGSTAKFENVLHT